jgi:antitoxin FitA
MPDLLISDIPPAVLGELEQRGAVNQRTAAEEAKSILHAVLANDLYSSWAAVDSIYARLTASGKSFADSAELLREDRDR